MSSSDTDSDNYTSEDDMDVDEYSQEDFDEDMNQVSPLRKEYPKNYNLHEIKVPTKERMIKEVEEPEKNFIKTEDFWKDGKPAVENIKLHLKKEGRIDKEDFHALIDRAYEIFCEEDNIVLVEAPVTVCGDIHGQYYDLLKLLDVGGDPRITNYLFLGDYVDRGNFSVECVILLFCYKVLYPKSFYMIRGNHECRHLTDYFTFREECEYKYDYAIYESIMDAFDALPLAAIMNKQFLCVHGGISPEIATIDDIRKINRFNEPPPSGPMCDLLWADPMEDFSPDVDLSFDFNRVRGCSYNYSFNAVCEFLERNKLLSIIRAHEAQDAGYRMHRKNEKTGFPSLITIFSAPNYLDAYNNKGAIMRYENNVINIKQFNQVPHPYYLPGFMNVFNWSLPFLSEKVSELLLSMIRLVDDAAAEQQEKDMERVNAETERKREALRNKVITVSRMLSLFRQEREKILNKKNGTLKVEGPLKENAEEGKDKFSVTKTIDRPNEARPPGIEHILEEVKREPSSPQALKRKQSRDVIISKKQQADLRALYETNIRTLDGPPKIKEINEE